jgi:UPF0716 family protein affecting phage T7 exclusion
MASREPALVIGSPFKTGFYAGLGFFFASIMMSVFGFLLLAILGFSTVAGLLLHAANGANSTPAAHQSNYVVRTQVSDGQ